jgi:5-(carboxyamino)imidazole ribonucleotide synthase
MSRGRSKHMPVIAPGSVIGIIGGGQLGRMTAMAAARLGYHVHIYCPEHDSPASEVAREVTVAPYNHVKALESFAKSVDVVTFEFENIPHESVELLEKLVPVHPSSELLKISRNRLREKDFINDLGIDTADYAEITSLDSLREALQEFEFPCILKTTEMGYDGKGQVKLSSASSLEEAWSSLHTDEAILEAFVPFEMEISVIVARRGDGEMVVYPPVQNIHENHILKETVLPAPISEQVAQEAVRIAGTIAAEAKLVGVLAVEMFVLEDGSVRVNEMAPRPHNSGHWTLDAAMTSQFEQQVRAICGLPLGSTMPLCGAKMLNLLGDDVAAWEDYLKDPYARLHLYGKAEARTGRKMGHVTFLRDE